MSNAKANKEITTKNGYVVVLKGAITYGEHLQIVDVYGDETITAKDKFRAADKLGAELVIVSINGETEKLYDKYLSMDLEDATEITALIKEVLNPKSNGNS